MSIKEYKTLFDDFYVSMCSFSFRYVGDLDVAKDIAQDIFVKMWEDEIELKNINNIKSYLYTSVKNKSLDYLKSKRYKSTDSLLESKIEYYDTESFFLREIVLTETSVIIEQAINKLPNKCADIIRLSLKEFTNLEIADELGVSINTVKTQKKIAYKKLRSLLEDFYFLLFFLVNVFR